MPLDVTSFFLVQLESKIPSAQIDRKFLISGSDYSDRVIKYPTIKRKSEEIRPVNITISLANEDGGLNHFYEDVYKIPNSCSLQLGFHDAVDSEYINLFSGFVKNVAYTEGVCKVNIKDRLADFTERKIGDSDSVVTFSDTIPSDIAWDLCTCYGELSNVASTSNADIDYQSFLDWAAQFSADSLTNSARFDGQKITEALFHIQKMNDSVVFVDGDGKIVFKRYTEADSNDFTLTNDEYKAIRIDVETRRLINKQHVYFDYAAESDYWQSGIVSVESTSVDSFGAHEDIVKSEYVWFISSADAFHIADRRINSFKYPPKTFDVETGLYPVDKLLGESCRLVDSFFGITSSSGWRIIDQVINLETGAIKMKVDEAAVLNAFYLDVDSLDHDNRYLL